MYINNKLHSMKNKKNYVLMQKIRKKVGAKNEIVSKENLYNAPPFTTK